MLRTSDFHARLHALASARGEEEAAARLRRRLLRASARPRSSPGRGGSGEEGEGEADAEESANLCDGDEQNGKGAAASRGDGGGGDGGDGGGGSGGAPSSFHRDSLALLRDIERLSRELRARQGAYVDAERHVAARASRWTEEQRAAYERAAVEQIKAISERVKGLNQLVGAERTQQIRASGDGGVWQLREGSLLAHRHGIVTALHERLHAACGALEKQRAARLQQVMMDRDRMVSGDVRELVGANRAAELLALDNAGGGEEVRHGEEEEEDDGLTAEERAQFAQASGS